MASCTQAERVDAYTSADKPDSASACPPNRPEDRPVHSLLSDALAQRGYDTLTPVQEAVTDPALEGRDLLVSAQTGSGKTVGFGLAIAPTLLEGDAGFGRADAPLALVIAPTRELALQVARELTWLYAGTGAVVTTCVGGMDMRDERRALGRGAHIAVATPGRLRDHIMRQSIDLSAVRAVVLDEADEMLDLGFREDLEFILGEAPEGRRTLMFSATVPKAIGKLAEDYQRDAARVTTVGEARQHADIDYRAMNVAARDAENAVINVLRYHEAPNAIVFCNTRAMVGRLTTRLSNRGFATVALSGELSQTERTHALQAMRDGRARVCVATDVAARGIDLPNLDLVVHAELPSNHETLLHRSGRTGRAGRKGTSALIVPPPARKKAERILKSAKVSATWAEAPSADEIVARDHARLMEDEDWAVPVREGEVDGVAALTAGFTPEQLAARVLRLLAKGQTAPEDLSPAGAAPGPRPPFGPSEWFEVTGGRAEAVSARWLLPVMCKGGGLRREDVGAIRVQDGKGLVEVASAAVPKLLENIGESGELEPGIVARKAQPPRGGDRGPAPDRPKARTVRDTAPPPPSAPAPELAPIAPVERAADGPNPAKGRPEGVVKAYAPRPKPAAGGRKDDRKQGPAGGKGAPKPGGKPAWKKGPPPPQGKPDSKKNRARAADASVSLRRGKPGAKPGPKGR